MKKECCVSIRKGFRSKGWDITEGCRGEGTRSVKHFANKKKARLHQKELLAKHKKGKYADKWGKC